MTVSRFAPPPTFYGIRITLEELNQSRLASGASRRVIALFVGALAYGLFLLLVFEPELQSAAPEELFARSGEARAFLVADLAFPFIYAAFGRAAWRFGTLISARWPSPVFAAAAIMLGIAAIIDIAEGVLLLAAIESESSGLVDFVHAMAIPKVISFAAGFACSLVVLALAVRVLRRGRRDSGGPGR